MLFFREVRGIASAEPPRGKLHYDNIGLIPRGVSQASCIPHGVARGSCPLNGGGTDRGLYSSGEDCEQSRRHKRGLGNLGVGGRELLGVQLGKAGVIEDCRLWRGGIISPTKKQRHPL